MTRAEQKICNQLKSVCELRTDSDCEIYQEAIEELHGHLDVDILRIMLNCLRDTDAGDIQYELIEACEYFPDDEYVSIFLQEAENVYYKSPNWFMLMFQSILNTKSCLNLFYIKFSNMDETQKKFFRILIKSLSKEEAYRSIYEKIESI